MRLLPPRSGAIRRPAGPRLLPALLSATGLALGAAVAAQPASAATPACQVTYTVINSSPGGFQVSLTVTNNAAALTGWNVGFQFPGSQTVSSGWSGRLTSVRHR